MIKKTIIRSLSWIGSKFLSSQGYKVVGDYPRQQSILIVAPHTSNWDFFYLLALGLQLGKMDQIAWMAKHTLFWGPVGYILRSLGGIPVNRKKSNNTVRTTVEHLQKNEDLFLAMSPEGTRRRTRHWKKGFYYLARKAELPVCLVFLDYQNKRLGFGPLVHLTGNEQEDLKPMQDFYQAEWARYPEDFGQPSFAEFKSDTSASSTSQN